MGQSNFPKTVVAAKRLLTEYIAMGKNNNRNYGKQEPYNAGVAFSKTDRDNDWKNNVSCHGYGFKGHQLKRYKKTSREEKKNIYAMKKPGTFKAKNTVVVNTAVEDTPSNDASTLLSVTISGAEHDQYQIFLGVCGEDPVELFNISEEE